MILQDQLAGMRADIEAGQFFLVPTADQVRTMGHTTKELIASGQAE